MGLAKILSVPTIVDEDKITAETDPKSLQSRSFEDILNDVIDTFCGLRRARRREILRMLRQARKEAMTDGNSGTKTT